VTTSEGSGKFRTSEIWIQRPTVGSSKMIAGDRDNRLSNANPPTNPLTLADKDVTLSWWVWLWRHLPDQSDRPPVLPLIRAKYRNPSTVISAYKGGVSVNVIRCRTRQGLLHEHHAQQCRPSRWSW